MRVSPIVLKRVIRSTASFWTHKPKDPAPVATSERPVVLDLIFEDTAFTLRSGNESKADR